VQAKTYLAMNFAQSNFKTAGFEIPVPYDTGLTAFTGVWTLSSVYFNKFFALYDLYDLYALDCLFRRLNADDIFLQLVTS
jgi:hypothetical protein